MKRPLLLLALLGTAACGGSDAPGGGPDPTVVLAANAPILTTAPVGAAVRVPPSVVVRDQSGTALSGVPVHFAVTAGGGSIAGTDTVSNGDGIASLSNWTLGAEQGSNTVVAATPGALSLAFRALGVASTCDTIPLPFATTVTGTLASSDCTFPDTSYVDYYVADLPAESEAYYLREASSDIDAYLVVFDSTGRPVAFNDDSLYPASSNSVVTLLVPPARYLVAANSYAAQDVGTYTLKVSGVTGQEDHCARIFTLPGLATDQTVAATDCYEAVDSLYGDLFWLYLDAGQQIRVSEQSASFDAQVAVYSGTNLILLGSNDNASDTTTDARLDFTAPQSGYYVVFATTAVKFTTGSYHLTIEPVAPGGAPGLPLRRGAPGGEKPDHAKPRAFPLHTFRPRR